MLDKSLGVLKEYERIQNKNWHSFLLVLAYFGIMLFYTFLDVVVWKKVVPDFSNIINIVTIAICIGVFIVFLKRTIGYQVQLLSNISFVGMMLSIGCSILFFLLLDRGDPIFKGMFPQSEQDYQEMIQSLIESPMTSLIQVCILAPVIEEILMRGVVLG